jgi:hypothetical protein
VLLLLLRASRRRACCDRCFECRGLLLQLGHLSCRLLHQLLQRSLLPPAACLSSTHRLAPLLPLPLQRCRCAPAQPRRAQRRRHLDASERSGRVGGGAKQRQQRQQRRRRLGSTRVEEVVRGRRRRRFCCCRCCR